MLICTIAFGCPSLSTYGCVGAFAIVVKVPNFSESENRMTLQANWHTETAEGTAVLLRSPALTSGSAAEAGCLERARGGAADAAGSEWSGVE